MTNVITLTQKGIQKGKQVESNQWTLQLTAECLGAWQERVFPFIEVELMQGTRRSMPCGRTEFCLELDDEKTATLRRALVRWVFKTTNS